MKPLVLILLAAGIAGAYWYFQDDLLSPIDEPVVVRSEPLIEKAVDSVGPLHPIAQSTLSDPVDRTLVTLPSLDDSDAYFLLALIDIFGTDVEHLLVNEALIDKIVTTVDNLTRAHIAEKIRPVGRLALSFSVDAPGGNGEFFLSPDSHERYNFLVDLVARAELEDIVETYRRFYPLFQESYLRLGYPDAYFNDRVVEVIDHLLLTPEPDEPIRLVRPHVLYEFADANLEALSSGQKLMLRMGAEHAERIKQVLRDLRALIA